MKKFVANIAKLIIPIMIIGSLIYYTDKYTLLAGNFVKDQNSLKKKTIGEYYNFLEKVSIPEEDSIIYTKDGKKFTSIYKLNYKYSKIEDISEVCKRAYIGIEDKRFFDHKGIDYRGIVRALITNYRSGSVKQGASTITQQVVKNTMVGSNKSLERKIKEFHLSPILEKDLGKDKILELYLNLNYYANGVNGITYASKYYFGKKPKDLNLRESCVLIALSNSPNRYNPKKHMKELNERVDVYLDSLRENEIITKDEYELAKNLDIEFKYKKPNMKSIDNITTFTMFQTTEKLMELDGFKFRYNFKSQTDEDIYRNRYNEIYKEFYQKIKDGGYKIFTNLDKKMYIFYDSLAVKYLGDYENPEKSMEMAIVTIDNKTQNVHSIYGGRSKSEFNRAFQAYRQPGSSIKPLISYGVSIDLLNLGSDLVENDEKIEGEYSPENVTKSYMGKVTLREALARSLNTISLKMLKKVDSLDRYKYINNFMFSKFSNDDNFNQSLSLGSMKYGISPYEMARAYAGLSNSGFISNFGSIDKIMYKNKVIFSNTSELEDIDVSGYNKIISKINETFKKEIKEVGVKKRVKKKSDKKMFRVSSSQLILNMMEDVVNQRYGTASKIKNKINFKDSLAVKTGTTNDMNDAWIVGITPKYTTVVWIGYDTPRNTKNHGNDLPLEILTEVLNKLYESVSNDGEKFDTYALINAKSYSGDKYYINSDNEFNIGIDSLAKVIPQSYFKVSVKDDEITDENINQDNLEDQSVEPDLLENKKNEKETNKEEVSLDNISLEDMDSIKNAILLLENNYKLTEQEVLILLRKIKEKLDEYNYSDIDRDIYKRVNSLEQYYVGGEIE